MSAKPKAADHTPHTKVALDTLAGVRGEMARLYRLGLNGKLESGEMTKFVYVLKEIRGCIEAEVLADVQTRLAALSAGLAGRHG